MKKKAKKKREKIQPYSSEEVGREEISNANLSSIRPETVNGYLCQKKGPFAASFSDLAFNSTLKKAAAAKKRTCRRRLLLFCEEVVL